MDSSHPTGLRRYLLRYLTASSKNASPRNDEARDALLSVNGESERRQDPGQVGQQLGGTGHQGVLERRSKALEVEPSEVGVVEAPESEPTPEATVLRVVPEVTGVPEGFDVTPYHIAATLGLRAKDHKGMSTAGCRYMRKTAFWDDPQWHARGTVLVPTENGERSEVRHRFKNGIVSRLLQASLFNGASQ